MRASSRDLDRLETTFDHDGLAANAGLIVPATLMARLGVDTLITFSPVSTRVLILAGRHCWICTAV